MLSRECQKCPLKKGRFGCENQYRYIDVQSGERIIRCRIDGSRMLLEAKH